MIAQKNRLREMTESEKEPKKKSKRDSAQINMFEHDIEYSEDEGGSIHFENSQEDPA